MGYRGNRFIIEKGLRINFIGSELPSHEEHCRRSLNRYGKRFDELHRWVDEPWEVLGKFHRIYRHDLFTMPQETRELSGEMADHACLDHIIRIGVNQNFRSNLLYHKC